MKKVIFFFVSILIFSNIIFVEKLYSIEILIVDKIDKKISVTPYIEYFEDVSNKITIDDIALGKANTFFKTAGNQTLNIGYTRNPIWISFLLKLNNENNEEVILEIENEFLQYIDIYYLNPEKKTVIFSRTGLSRENQSRNVKSKTFAWNLSELPKGSIQVYIKIQSFTSKGLPLFLWNSVEYYKKENLKNLFITFLSGFLLALLFYQMIIGILLNSKEYIVLGCLIGVYVILFLNTFGYIYTFWIINRYFSFYKIQLFFYSLFGYFFTYFSFLYINRELRYEVIFNTIKKLYILSLALSVVLPHEKLLYLMIFLMGLIVLSFVYIGIIMTKLLFQGKKEDLYVLISFLPTIAFGTARFVRNLGFISDTVLTRYGIVFAFPVTLLFLSTVISFRFNLIQKESEKLKEDALEREKSINRIKEQFLINTAHEIKTPLNGIIGLTEDVRFDESEKLSRESINNLDLVINSSKRLSRLVNDVLDYSRIKENRLELNQKTVNIKDIANVVISYVKPLVKGKDIRIKNEIDNTARFVIADEDRIIQVIFNLLSNAAKFTNKGLIKIESFDNGDFILIKISDTGRGIDNEKLESIFNLYEQGEDEIPKTYGGYGIGLSVTRHILEAHGSSIKAESGSGTGSSFSFLLKKAAGDLIPMEIDSITAESIEEETTISYREVPKDNRYKIAVVDDNPINIQVLVSRLKRTDYDTETMTSGIMLLEKMENGYKPDLVLLDVIMPDMNGYEVCRKIRETNEAYEVPVIMVTARDRAEDLLEGLNSGANDYITKPVNGIELLARVNTHLKIKKAIKEKKEYEDELSGMEKLIIYGMAFIKIAGRNSSFDKKTEDLLFTKALAFYRPVFEKRFGKDYSDSKIETIQKHHESIKKIFEKVNENSSVLEKAYQNIDSILKGNKDINISEHEEVISNMICEMIGIAISSSNGNRINSEKLQKEYNLTSREIEIIEYIYKGFSNEEIGEKLSIKLTTVKSHCTNIFNKLGVDNRSHLIFTVLNL